MDQIESFHRKIKDLVSQPIEHIQILGMSVDFVDLNLCWIAAHEVVRKQMLSRVIDEGPTHEENRDFLTMGLAFSIMCELDSVISPPPYDGLHYDIRMCSMCFMEYAQYLGLRLKLSEDMEVAASLEISDTVSLFMVDFFKNRIKTYGHNIH